MNIGKKIQVNLFLAIILGIILFLLGYITTVHITFSVSLDSLSKFADILTGLSAVVAIIAFIGQIKKDKTLAAVQQITFFREKILPEQSAYINKVKAAYPQYQ